ncbi:MAG: hypothetical protein H7288_05060, partial [Kineosporiaceae bacterium]|nr:hypothetical protein [Aeromicrobium sp.]
IWDEMDKDQRRISKGALAVGGLCARCHRRPELPDPGPGAPFSYPDCDGCSKEMVSPTHWRRAGPAERAELLEEGYVHERREGRCHDCIGPKKFDVRSTLTDEQIAARKGRRGLTVRQYIECHAAGMTNNAEIARTIGISSNGLRKALRTARQAGQELP